MKNTDIHRLLSRYYETWAGINAAYDRIAARCGVTSNVLYLLDTLYCAEAPMTQSEIGARLGLPKQTVASMVSTLERRGYVVREVAKDDHRRRHVLLTDEGRKATWVVEVKTTKKPEAQLLGSAIGMKVMEDVPYIRGLDAWLGTELNKDNKAYLKDFGAATASNGAVGLYHIEHLTPEAMEQGDALIAPGAQVYVVDDAELERVKASYPVIWKNPNAKPKLAFIGCPHLTMDQLIDWTKKLEEGLKASGRDKLAVPTVLTTAPPVLEEFNKGPYAYRLKKTGAILSYICPLMYMNNPLSKSMPVITCSNKLRTYTSAKFYSEDEIVGIITGKETK